MVSEHDPVEEKESLLRLVPMAYYDPTLNEPIPRIAFKPSGRDRDGLSFYRDRFVTPADLVRQKGKEYVVARISVVEFLQRGFTVEPSPQPGPPGHCVVPELGYDEYCADKARHKDIQLELARLAAAGIAYVPGGSAEPEGSD